MCLQQVVEIHDFAHQSTCNTLSSRKPLVLKMSQLTRDFLRDIDDDLLVYSQQLEDKGFTNTKSLKHLTEGHLNFVKEGHRLLIMEHVKRLANVSYQ